VLVSGLLLRLGLQVKLIQSNEGFNLNNLYELRYFSEIINKSGDTPLIADEDWVNAKRQLNSNTNTSTKNALANAVIRAFEDTNTIKKYKSDWAAFLGESKIEDFLHIDSEAIYVSTIHKAKGKEFDNVFLLLSDYTPATDERKRQLYVAITRAKSNLSIHYNGGYLKPFSVEGLIYERDSGSYPESREITIYLTHRDVQLGYFEYIQHRLTNLLSGSLLSIIEEGLGNSKRELVLKYSQKFRELLRERAEKGFHIFEARVNFIVYWKDEVKEKESMIILPQLILKKS
jgi:ATP-dependent DNA helicase RecQ